LAHPLDGARLKLGRAHEHLASLKSEISAGTAPAPRLAVIIGDCVTNARSALDHVAWQLAGLPGVNPPRDSESPRDRRFFSFPISIHPYSATPAREARMFCEQTDEFRERSLPPAAIAEIMAVQPYNRGFEPLNDLRTLVNIDRRCVASLALVTAPARAVTWNEASLPRESPVTTLEKIIGSVADVIPRFDGFF